MRAWMVPSRALVAFFIATLAMVPPMASLAQDSSYCQPGETPAFGREFGTLVGALGAVVGEPTECEHLEPVTGDVQQRTTDGLLYWRQRTNIPTFTNGAEHFAVRDAQLFRWAGDAVDPPGLEVAGVVASGPPDALSQVLERWGVYFLFAISVVFFVVGMQNRAFTWRALGFFVVMTIATGLFLYASPFQLTWNLSWPGDEFRLFPPVIPVGVVTIGLPAGDAISKSNSIAWFLISVLPLSSITFPLAVLSAAALAASLNLTNIGSMKGPVLLLANLVAFAYVGLVSLVALLAWPYQATNPWLMGMSGSVMALFMFICLLEYWTGGQFGTRPPSGAGGFAPGQPDRDFGHQQDLWQQRVDRGSTENWIEPR